MSSFAVVRKIKHACQVRKVGHAGTLDPAATGLLILLTGKATRQQGEVSLLEKEYRATILLGVVTDTWDLAGKIIRQQKVESIEQPEVARLLEKRFCGEIWQCAPAYSALKYAGIPGYRLARQGQTPELKRRRVTIREIEIENYAFPEVAIRVVCSSGFYVRSLAYDLGEALGCGAVLKSLVRTRIGEYHLEDAWSLGELATKLGENRQGERARTNQSSHG